MIKINSKIDICWYLASTIYSILRKSTFTVCADHIVEISTACHYLLRKSYLKNNWVHFYGKYLNALYFHHMKNTVPPSSANMGRNIYLFTSRIPLSFLSSLFCAELDPDPNYHFDADPVPDPDSILMPTQIRIRIWKGIKTMPIDIRILPQVLHILLIIIFFTFSPFSHALAILQCFVFLISVNEITIFRILDRIFRFPAHKKYRLSPFFAGNYTDPAQWCGSDQIQIYNTRLLCSKKICIQAAIYPVLSGLYHLQFKPLGHSMIYNRKKLKL